MSNKRYLSTQNEWNDSFISVPCKVFIMTSEDSYIHVKDVYDKMIYKIIQHVYLIKK